jgi:hypothetical protein
MQAKLRVTLTDAHFSIAHRLKAGTNFDGSLILLTYINTSKPSPIQHNVSNVSNVMKKDDSQKATNNGEQVQKETEGNKPAVEGNKPVVEGSKPAVEGSKPAVEGKPITEESEKKIPLPEKERHNHNFPNIAAIVLQNVEGKLVPLSQMHIDPKYPYICDGVLEGTTNVFTLVDANETAARIRIFSIHDQKILLEKTREINEINGPSIFGGYFFEENKYIVVSYCVDNSKSQIKIIKSNDLLDMYSFDIPGKIITPRLFKLKSYYFSLGVVENNSNRLRIYLLPDSNRKEIKLQSEVEISNDIDSITNFTESRALIAVGVKPTGLISSANIENRRDFRMSAPLRPIHFKDILWFKFDENNIKPVGNKEFNMLTRVKFHPTGAFVVTSSCEGEPIPDILNFYTLDRHEIKHDMPELNPIELPYHVAPNSDAVFSGNGKWLIATGMNTGRLHNNIFLYSVYYDIPENPYGETEHTSPKKVSEKSGDRVGEKVTEKITEENTIPIVHHTLTKEVDCPHCHAHQKEQASHISVKSHHKNKHQSPKTLEIPKFPQSPQSPQSPTPQYRDYRHPSSRYKSSRKSHSREPNEKKDSHYRDKPTSRKHHH